MRVETGGNNYCSLNAPSQNTSESEINFANGLAQTHTEV